MEPRCIVWILNVSLQQDCRDGQTEQLELASDGFRGYKTDISRERPLVFTLHQAKQKCCKSLQHVGIQQRVRDVCAHVRAQCLRGERLIQQPLSLAR